MENLEAGVDIISPGCAISPKRPNANLRSQSLRMNKSPSGRKRLTITLSAIFALAVVMGAANVYLGLSWIIYNN